MKIKKSMLGVLASALLVITACSSPQTNDPGEGTATPPAAESVAGGTLRVGVNSLPPGLGNPFTGIGAQSVYTWSAVFDPLVLVDNEGVPQPWLATSWENLDPLNWEFKLRDGIKFSNGENFDAEAVKATIDFLVSEDGKTTAVGAELKVLESVEVVDPQTVRITTSTPDSILPSRLSAVYIIAPGAWAELGPDGYATKPVGTGPFEIQTIDANKATGTAYSDSWRAPIADEIEITLLGDVSARVQALQSGQLDVAISLSPDQVGAIEASGATIHASAAPQVMAMAFTQTIGDGDKAINDPKVRIALNHAIDRQAISDTIMAGLARPAVQGSTPETFGFNPALKGFDYNPEKAKQLLEEAGYGDGLDLTASVTVGSFPGDGDIWQAVQDYLSKVGVNITFETVQFAQWLERYQQNTWPGDLFNQSWNTAPVGDSIRPAMIFSCLKSNPFVCEEDLVPLIEAINAEFDTSKRESLLFELAEEYEKNPPSLLLVEQVDLNATSENTKGFEMASRYISYEKISVK